jgi:hypothetical protein
MATIGKVSAVFTASTSGLRTGVNQASRSMQQMQSSVASLRGQLSTLTAIQGAQLFGQIANAATQAVQSLVRFGASAAQSIDRTAKLSQQLGLTYAEMSGLSLAASLAGTDMETVGNAVTKANAAFANAAAGSKSAVAAFARIGLSVDDLNGLSAADQFEKIGQAIASLPSEAEQAAAAIALFGRSGAQLLPLFQGAVSSMDAAVTKARELGVALEGVAVSGAADVLGEIANAASAPIGLNFESNASGVVGEIANAASAPIGLNFESNASGVVGEIANAASAPIGLNFESNAATVFDQINAAARNPVEVSLEVNATNALKDIGLAFDQISNLSGEDRFKAIGQAIAEIPTQAERAAAAVAIFGKAGADLLPLFQKGAGGISAARADAEKFGLALNNVQAGNVEAMNDAFTRARSAVEGVVNQVVAYLAPALENVTTVFTDLIGGIGGANIGQFIGEAILSGARFFAGVADQFVAQAGPLFDYLASVGQQWAAMWDIGQRVASLFAGIGNLLKAAILAAILPFSGLVQGLARIGKEIAGYLGFDTSSIDVILEGARAFNSEIVKGIKDQVGQAGTNFGNVIGEKSKKAGEDVAGPFTKALDDATRRAREAAAARDEAVKQVVEVKQPPVVIDAKPIKEAVKGIESRSSEGIREMFRIMRGQPAEDIDRQQLEVQREIARNTRDMGDSFDFDVVALPAAAGA